MLTLVDSGPLVAILDKGDSWHRLVRDRWSSVSGRFMTTGAVITEAMHFLSPIPGGPGRLLQFIDLDILGIDDAFRVSRLPRLTK